MPGPYYAVLGGARIADASFDGSGDFQDLSGSDDANVTNFADSTFNVVCNINSAGKETEVAAYKLQWQNDASPGYVDLSGAGELVFGATDLTDGDPIYAVASGNHPERICDSIGHDTFINGEQTEGVTNSDDVNLADEQETELAWAVDCSGATGGATYSFKLLDVTNTRDLGALGSTITMTAAATNINAGLVQFTIAANNATVNAGVSVQVGVPASLTVTPKQATLLVPTGVSAGNVSLTLAAKQADVNLDKTVSASNVTLTLAAQKTTVNAAISLQAGAPTSLTVATQQATVTTAAATEISAGNVSLTLAAYQAAVNAKTSLQVGSPVSLTVAAKQASLLVPTGIQVGAPASLTVATKQATLLVPTGVQVGAPVGLTVATKQATIFAPTKVQVGAPVGLTVAAKQAALLVPTGVQVGSPVGLTLAAKSAGVKLNVNVQADVVGLTVTALKASACWAPDLVSTGYPRSIMVDGKLAIKLGGKMYQIL